jgi:hypothetical protein
VEPDPTNIDEENQGEDALTVDQQDAIDEQRDEKGEQQQLDLHAPVTPPD